MLSKPTILVLGAGASFDFGMPLGDRLASQLRGALSFEFDDVSKGLKAGDPALIDAYKTTGQDLGSFLRAGAAIAKALPSFKSIDDCLHTHADNELGVLAGKMAIAANIAAAERGCSVNQLWQSDPQIRSGAEQQIREGWMGTLVQVLVTGVSRRDYANVFKDLIIVSFNYDRCAEAVLFKLIQTAFGIGPNEAAEATQNLRVYHPYGSLGSLQLAGEDGMPFAPANLDLLEAANRLFVYTEAREQPPEILEVKKAVYETSRLIFLGFGFHRQNIELLAPGRPGQERFREVYGTVYHEPGPGVEAYRARLGQALRHTSRLELIDDNCASFMREFRAVFGD